MSRDYAPIGLNPLPPLNEIHSQYSGFEYTSEPNEAPEIAPYHDYSGDTPLVTTRSRQALSPETSYDSFTYQNKRTSSDPQVRPNISRTFSQQSTIRRKKVHSSSLSSLKSGFFAVPFHKDVLDKNRPYARHYSFRRTRDKLFVRGFKQWLITLAFAGIIAGALAGYEKYATINPQQKHAFNAIITGLSICLGMNLASALRAYAELMRWRLLSIAWLSLREFDLVMHCGSLLKVCELMLETVSRKFPYISLIHLIATAWLLFNATAQILVAMLGLTYSLDTSTGHIFVPGPVIIADLTLIKDKFGSGSGSELGQMFSAHAYGVQGQDFGLQPLVDPFKNTTLFSGVLLTDLDYTYTGYRFLDINADATSANYAAVASNRTVWSIAFCDTFNVISINGDDLAGYTVSYNDGHSGITSLFVPASMPGAMTWMGDLNGVDCGARCTHVIGLQTKQEQNSPNDQLSIDRSTIYKCNNTVYPIDGLSNQGAQYRLRDKQARYIAGAIGWSGYGSPSVDGNFDPGKQYVVYSSEAYWSPPAVLDAHDAASYVTQFSAGALAAIDQNGAVATIHDILQPQRALLVTVQWKYTISLLSCIVTMQMIALMLVILWANKSVIVDDSFLSISRLLGPTVRKLGDQGSVLRGEEIAAAVEDRLSGLDGKYKIFYGCRDLTDDDVENGDVSQYRDGFGRGILRAGIIEKGDKIEPKKDRPFVDGTYD